MDSLPDLVINPAYSPELGELREEMDDIKGEVDELHQEARDGWCDFDKASLSCLFENVHTSVRFVTT